MVFVVASGFKAGAFGGVALFAVIFYASGIPRVQNDILMKIPFLEKYYVKEIPPSDNVSCFPCGDLDPCRRAAKADTHSLAVLSNVDFLNGSRGGGGKGGVGIRAEA